MAVLKQRMNRKNAAGEYDTVHMETSADIVLMPDGTTKLSDKITTIEREIGIGEVRAGVPTTLGATYNFAGYNWTIVHVIDHLIYAITTDIIRIMAFGPAGVNIYAASAAAEACYDFQYSIPPADAAVLSSVPVNGVVCKVFLPSYHRMNGGFSWFNSNERRIAKYNGTAKEYWTSSQYHSANYVWAVGADGIFISGNANYGPSTTRGFRPCIAFRR